MKTKILISILVGMLVISFVSAVLAIPANDNAVGVERVPVFIGFTQTPGPSEQALVRSHGGAIKYSYHLVPAIAASIPEPAIQGLLRNPNVTYIEPDIKVYAVDDELDNTWGVKRIGAGTVHDGGNKGTGIKVAIIDSGIDTDHPDLNVVGGRRYLNRGEIDDDLYDDDAGHGTHVAGTVAALDNGIGVVGVAPEASLYAVKVLDSSGSGWTSDVAAGIQWSKENGMEVINMSLGGGYSETLETACNNADAAEIVLVASAGNSGNPQGRGDNIGYPAAYASVIAVGATDDSDNRARFSSTGSALELMAPGVDILSTYIGGGYATGDGTSMAAPHVAGTAALAIAAGVTDVRGALVSTADDLGDSGWDTKYGYGLVDADEAAGAPEEPITDIAITAVSAPRSVVQGDLVDVSVTVENVGNQDVPSNITATLTDDGVTIGTQTISGGLAAGASAIVNFSWDTTGATFGEHTLTASHGFADDDATNDSMSTTVNVTEAGGATVMHVAGIEMALSTKKAGRNIFTKAVATVTIVDASGNPVEGATVYGSWSGATSDSDSGLTDPEGKLTLESDAVKNASSGTTFTFTVDNVVKSGWDHDKSASETSDSITVP